MVNYSAPDRRPRKLYPGVRTGAAVLWYSLTGALRDIFGPHSVAEVGGSPDTGACMSTKTVISFTLFPSSYFFSNLLRCLHLCIIPLSSPENWDDGERSFNSLLHKCYQKLTLRSGAVLLPI